MATTDVTKHYKDLPENKVFAALTLADRLLADNTVINSHANLVDGFSLLSCYLETIGLPLLSKTALQRNGASLEIRDATREALGSLRDLIGKEMQARTTEYGFRQFGHLFEGTTTFEFADAEVSHIQSTINQLREIISQAACLDERHKKRLPARGQRTRTNGRTKRGKRVAVGGAQPKAATKT